MEDRSREAAESEEPPDGNSAGLLAELLWQLNREIAPGARFALATRGAIRPIPQDDLGVSSQTA